jgi:hypothetical protein
MNNEDNKLNNYQSIENSELNESNKELEQSYE